METVQTGNHLHLCYRNEKVVRAGRGVKHTEPGPLRGVGVG